VSALRVALIGARRVRQGLGPFVARFLAELGVEVPAILGTSASTVSEALADLERDARLAPRGYTALEDLLAGEELDALAILSPAETHGRYLEAALEAGLSVLCEKPLLWGGADLAGRARRLADGFARAGLYLAENCQWPYVLPAFRALHPAAADEPLRSFAMQLSPASQGAQRIGDALPHPLSLLQVLVPGSAPSLEHIAFAGGEPLVVTFEYATREARVPCRVELLRDAGSPREASLTLDGRKARRRVRLEDYALFLAAEDGREVPLADPLRALLADFARDLARAAQGRLPAPHVAQRIPERAALLDRLLDAYRQEFP